MSENPLASLADYSRSFLHHKHVPPDIRRHRVPAPNMSFIRPNFPGLIAEIEAL